MRIVDRLLSTIDQLVPPVTAHAHCDLPCGVYDPAQARIEAESVKGCMEKFNASDWTDYFKPEHVETYPDLSDIFWKATKKAGEAKKTNDVKVADELLGQIAQIDKIFKETKKA